jgi:DNA-binding NarL/FixJ family response regulator
MGHAHGRILAAIVKAHVSRILTKLDLNNRTQIALLAHDAGLTV